jgi:hypothetical protein
VVVERRETMLAGIRRMTVVVHRRAAVLLAAVPRAAVLLVRVIATEAGKAHLRVRDVRLPSIQKATRISSR